MAQTIIPSSAQQPPNYLSPRSANALISDLRPTQLHPQALHHLNLLLDELVVLLVTAAQSLNTEQVKHVALTSVFGGENGARGLGRTAVSEAEIELRSWMSAMPERFALGGNETGVQEGYSFPTAEAVALLRCKIVAFSTLAAQITDPEVDARLLEDWKRAGGDPGEAVWAPASLYVTAIIEHVCEHILANVGRVVARDSSVAVAKLQDLYVALCEDESIWGLFNRMEIKGSIEAAMRPSESRRRTQSRNTSNANSPTQSPNPNAGSPSTLPPTVSRGLGHSVSLDSVKGGQPRKKKTSNNSSTGSRPSGDSPASVSSSGGIGFIAGSASPSRGIRGIIGSKHERTPSVLSNNTRSMLGAYDEAYGSDSARAEKETEFDALVKSGETMKVSLTPSRLKNFESTTNQGAPGQSRPTASQSHRDLSSRASASIRASPSMGHVGGTRQVPRDQTINEDEDAEDIKLVDAKPKKRKESLIDLLNSDPPWKDSQPPPRRISGGTVAALLGAVPSTGGKAGLLLGPGPSVPRPVTHAKLQPRDDARSDLDDLNEFTFDKSRKKSSTRELMEFLDNTPPPPDPGSPVSGQSTTVSRKDSRFKSLVSKLTGSKDKERSAASALPAPPVHKQRSFQSSSATSSPSIKKTPIAATESVRKGSDGRLDPEVLSAVAVKRNDNKPTKGSSPERVPLSAQAVTLGLPIVVEDHYVGPTTGDAVVTGREFPMSGAPLQAVTPMIGLGVMGMDVAAHIGSASGAREDMEVAPQSEHSSSNPETPTKIGSEYATPLQEQEEAITPSTETAPVPLPVSRAPSPAATSRLSLEDLVPLRHLLDHATSARECQLLLGAVLSQWGVPHVEAEAMLVTPESRVTAWLLAGREGPVDGVPPIPANANVVTPQMNSTTAICASRETPIPSSDADIRRPSMDRSDEEVLSEVTGASGPLNDSSRGSRMCMDDTGQASEPRGW